MNPRVVRTGVTAHLARAEGRTGGGGPGSDPSQHKGQSRKERVSPVRPDPSPHRRAKQGQAASTEAAQPHPGLRCCLVVPQARHTCPCGVPGQNPENVPRSVCWGLSGRLCGEKETGGVQPGPGSGGWPPHTVEKAGCPLCPPALVPAPQTPPLGGGFHHHLPPASLTLTSPRTQRRSRSETRAQWEARPAVRHPRPSPLREDRPRAPVPSAEGRGGPGLEHTHHPPLQSPGHSHRDGPKQ